MFNRLRRVVLNTHCTALVIAMLMLVALFVGGAQPEAAGLIPAPWDKLAHVVYFLVFTFLLLRFAGFPLALVVVLALLVGAVDEMHQSCEPIQCCRNAWSLSLPSLVSCRTEPG